VPPAEPHGVVAVASFSAAVLTEIYLGNVCSCHEILRRNGRGQGAQATTSKGWLKVRAMLCNHGGGGAAAVAVPNG
jgi:hypothetical protein